MDAEHEALIPIEPQEDTKEFQLRLRRFAPVGTSRGKSVLLLHGANNSSDAFLAPSGGLVQYLRARGFEVWLLDWRSSAWVLKRPPLSDGTFATPARERELFCLDRVVTEDLPRAIDYIYRRTERRTSIVGFCMGAAALSMAIAKQTLTAERVDALVLMTVGLFLRSPWQTWLKSREYILDQCIDEVPDSRSVDPHRIESWPEPLADSFRRWPRELLPAGAEDWFQHLTFLYGEPYDRALVEPCLKDVREYFGPLHLGFFLEAARLLRQGHVPATRLCEDGPLSTELQAHFAKHRLTLIGGAQGRLWHRESLDLMYDWLRRVTPRPAYLEKFILPGYAHNDLLWAEQAPKDVFERIESGL